MKNEELANVLGDRLRPWFEGMDSDDLDMGIKVLRVVEELQKKHSGVFYNDGGEK